MHMLFREGRIHYFTFWELFKSEWFFRALKVLLLSQTLIETETLLAIEVMTLLLLLKWIDQGHLSVRMRIPGNIWLETWQTAKAVPARRQKRLFDDTKEAEKVYEVYSDFVYKCLSFLLITTPRILHSSFEKQFYEKWYLTLSIDIQEGLWVLILNGNLIFLTELVLYVTGLLFWLYL